MQVAVSTILEKIKGFQVFRDWNELLLDGQAFKNLHIRIGEHNYVDPDELDGSAIDLGIDQTVMPELFKSDVILRVGHLHFSRLRSQADTDWMNRILEMLTEKEICLTNLEIKNCESLDPLQIEKLLPKLQGLVLMDRTGHEHFFKYIMNLDIYTLQDL